MFLKKFDVISPPITLYYKGDIMHSSIFSGILTIVVYIIIFIFGVYYALEFIYKKNPTAFFFNRYIEDAGIFPLNSSSMFHYIKLQKTIDSSISTIDFDSIRIIGIESVTIDNYPSVDLKNTRHWLYGLCNNLSDTESIGYLITSDDYRQCACIRQYYDPKKNQYYNTNDQNFVWPIISHGMSNENHTYYGIIIGKCQDDDLREKSGLSACKASEEINNYVFSNLITIYLIDHFSDVLNYHKPFSKYFYSVSNMLFPNYFTVNNLNFNPAITKTHNGIFFDNIVEQLSYFFSLNEKVTMEEVMEIQDEEGNPTFDENGNKITKSTGIVSSYYFWMQNRLQFYERNYKRLQDIMSDIGGLSRVVLIIAIFANTLVSNYIILLDIEELSLSLNKSEKEKEKKKLNRIRPTIFRKIKLLINPPPRKTFFLNDHKNPSSSNNIIINIQQSSNLQRFTKEDEDIIQENTFINDRNDNIKYKRNNYVKKNNNINNAKDGNQGDKRPERAQNQRPYRGNYDIRRKYEIRNDANKSKLNEYIANEDITGRKKNNNKNEEDIFNRQNQNDKKNVNWFEYIKYMLYCSRNNNNAISYYEEFRAKFLSEEMIVQNHLDWIKFFGNSFEKESKENKEKADIYKGKIMK